MDNKLKEDIIQVDFKGEECSLVNQDFDRKKFSEQYYDIVCDNEEECGLFEEYCNRNKVIFERREESLRYSSVRDKNWVNLARELCPRSFRSLFKIIKIELAVIGDMPDFDNGSLAIRVTEEEDLRKFFEYVSSRDYRRESDNDYVFYTDWQDYTLNDRQLFLIKENRMNIAYVSSANIDFIDFKNYGREEYVNRVENNYYARVIKNDIQINNTDFSSYYFQTMYREIVCKNHKETELLEYYLELNGLTAESKEIVGGGTVFSNEGIYDSKKVHNVDYFSDMFNVINLKESYESNYLRWDFEIIEGEPFVEWLNRIIPLTNFEDSLENGEIEVNERDYRFLKIECEKLRIEVGLPSYKGDTKEVVIIQSLRQLVAQNKDSLIKKNNLDFLTKTELWVEEALKEQSEFIYIKDPTVGRDLIGVIIKNNYLLTISAKHVENVTKIKTTYLKSLCDTVREQHTVNYF